MRAALWWFAALLWPVIRLIRIVGHPSWGNDVSNAGAAVVFLSLMGYATLTLRSERKVSADNWKHLNGKVDNLARQVGDYDQAWREYVGDAVKRGPILMVVPSPEDAESER